MAGRSSDRLVAVEGIDGAGKSTLAGALVSGLRASGETVVCVSRYMIPELTDLWRYLVDADAVDQSGAAAIAAADQWLGIRQHVAPALAAGAYVVADRSYYSHLVYFALRGLEPARLLRQFSFALEPSLIVYLSVSPETAELRLSRTGKPDFWEAGLDYRVDATIGQAYRRYGRGTAARHLLLSSYREVQRRALDLYSRILPPERTLVLDGELPVNDLVRRTLAAMQGTAVSCSRTG